MIPPESRRVLLVDDDASVLRASAQLLERAGFAVTAVSDGHAALRALSEERYSVVVSDIMMEGMSGLELLRLIKERDADLPVVMVTGGPSLATAIEAMHNGAHRYLLKPIALEEFLETVNRAALLYELARLKREAFALQQGNIPVHDHEQLNATFSRALERLHIVYHPIISLKQRRTIGFEALVRSGEGAMRSPSTLLDAAGLLGRQPELSRAIYAHIARDAPSIRDGLLIFVNVHPHDLLEPSLHGQGSPLAAHASRIVLEVTERASLDNLGDLAPFVAGLRGLGYRLAVDDLGTGYAGLMSFTHLTPEFVKLDRSLVAGIHRHQTKQRVVGAMYALCADLGMQVISEGVETVEERDALVALGADLLQGYLFARPSEEVSEPILVA
jgi:EAL domain-containing protein (putative c-di-GMP-specific phosphodiesterase class I)/ActR/RegA family two-component response regulator